MSADSDLLAVVLSESDKVAKLRAELQEVERERDALRDDIQVLEAANERKVNLELQNARYREALDGLRKVWVEYEAEGDWKLLIDELTERLFLPAALKGERES